MVRSPADAAMHLKPSLRTEMLLNLAVLAAGALVLAVFSAVLAPLLGQGLLRFVLLTALVVADVAIFIGFGRYLVTRLVTEPMDTLVGATQAVAAGEMARRAPPGATREFDRLAESVNLMTERLLDAQSALVRAEKLASVGRLAAGVAHEIGNPLAAIGNYLELLGRRGAAPELVTAIERESSRIDTIVRSLLDYARPRDAAARAGGSGRDRAARRGAAPLAGPVPRGARRGGLCRRPAAHARRRGGARAGVREPAAQRDRCGGRGRAHRGDGERHADRRRRRRAPRRRSGRHGRGGRVARRSGRHLESAADGTSAVQVTVCDSGPGVPEDLAERVFDPFFTTKPPGKGTGLGLAIVQRIVHDHGGRVDVARAREGGAAFTVIFPGIVP